jgi:hypothetical protein
MKAIIFTRYGPPDSVELMAVPKPLSQPARSLPWIINS